MRKSFFSKCLLSLSVVVFSIISVSAPAVAASTIIKLYLGPSSASVSRGTHFPVEIRLSKNDTTSINYVRADLNFPADKLSVASVSLSGGYFTFANSPYTFVNYDNSAGTIDVGGQSPSVARSGDFLVATVNFVAKNSGAAAVAFNGQSAASFPRNGANQLTGTTGSTYTVPGPPTPAPATTPAPSPTPITSTTPSPVNSSSPARSSAATPASNRTAAPLAASSAPTQPGASSLPSTPAAGSLPIAADEQLNIADPLISSITARSAKLSWKTNLESTAIVKYGYGKDTLNHSLSQNDLQTNHSLTLNNLTPRTKIYYEIIADNAALQSTYKGYFTTLAASNLSGILLIAAGSIGGLLMLVLLAIFVKKSRRMPAPRPAGHELTADIGEEALAGAGLPPTPISSPPPPEHLPDDTPPEPVPSVINQNTATEAPAPLPIDPPSTSVPAKPFPALAEPDSGDIPDMFELGEQRLKKEEQNHLIP